MVRSHSCCCNERDRPALPALIIWLLRLERMRIANGSGENHLEAELATSMSLGDKWEHLFALGGNHLRAYGHAPLNAGRHWLELPRRDLWIF